MFSSSFALSQLSLRIFLCWLIRTSRLFVVSVCFVFYLYFEGAVLDSPPSPITHLTLITMKYHLRPSFPCFLEGATNRFLPPFFFGGHSLLTIIVFILFSKFGRVILIFARTLTPFCQPSQSRSSLSLSFSVFIFSFAFPLSRWPSTYLPRRTWRDAYLHLFVNAIRIEIPASQSVS